MMKIMRQLFVFGLVLVAAFNVAADDWVEKLHSARKHCSSDPHPKVDDAILVKLKNREITDWKLVEGYTTCAATHMGLLDADGKIQVETVRKALKGYIQDEAKLEEAVKDCAKQHEEPGKTAFITIACMRDRMGDNDFFKN